MKTTGHARITVAFCLLLGLLLAEGCMPKPTELTQQEDCGVAADGLSPSQKSGTVFGEDRLTLDLGDGVTMTLVRIPAGSFTVQPFVAGQSVTSMVPTDSVPPQKSAVTIGKPFYMGATEVTQAQWKSVMGTEPWKGKKYVKACTEGPVFRAEELHW